MVMGESKCDLTNQAVGNVCCTKDNCQTGLICVGDNDQNVQDKPKTCQEQVNDQVSVSNDVHPFDPNGDNYKQIEYEITDRYSCK